RRAGTVDVVVATDRHSLRPGSRAALVLHSAAMWTGHTGLAQRLFVLWRFGVSYGIAANSLIALTLAVGKETHGARSSDVLSSDASNIGLKRTNGHWLIFWM
ncbi:MAG: hypothetical protein ABI832_17925, partial [bacterium]